MKTIISLSAKPTHYVIRYIAKGKKAISLYSSGSTKALVRSDIKELQKNGHTVVGVRKITQTSMNGGNNVDSDFSDLF